MNIAIDITPIHNEHSARGVGSYTRLLISALQKYEDKHSYLFFTRGEKVPSNVLKNKIVLGEPENVDLVHYPYFDPFFTTLPLRKPLPTIVTVHDLIPLVFPDKFPRGMRGELTWQIQKFSLRLAHTIITDSEASKKDVVRMAGIPSEKINVVHLAPAPIFKPVADTVLLTSVKAKYALPDRFILYVGDVNWNKNISGMLRAFRELRTQNAKLNNTKLILVGKAFGDDRLPEMQEINRLIQSLHLTREVKKLGFVPDKDLPVLYSLASVYVAPSFYEGFGLPVLEAMACGCPVVTGEGSSLREIAGPAVLADPANPESISRGIRRVLHLSTVQYAKLSESGIAWAKKFTWREVARQTVAIYEKALERN